MLIKEFLNGEIVVDCGHDEHNKEKLLYLIDLHETLIGEGKNTIRNCLNKKWQYVYCDCEYQMHAHNIAESCRTISYEEFKVKSQEEMTYIASGGFMTSEKNVIVFQHKYTSDGLIWYTEDEIGKFGILDLEPCEF